MRAGVRSIVDFTAVPLRVPDDVFVEHMDITSALESAAFFARQDRRRSATPDADNGAENGAEAEMEPIIQTIDTLLAGADMKLEELAQTDRRPGTHARSRGRSEVTRIYAGDRVSDLLNEASSKTLLVTNLANLQMVRVAELMEVPGICFVDGVEPGPGDHRAGPAQPHPAHGLPRRGVRDLRPHLPAAGRPETGTGTQSGTGK